MSRIHTLNGYVNGPSDFREEDENVKKITDRRTDDIQSETCTSSGKLKIKHVDNMYMTCINLAML